MLYADRGEFQDHRNEERLSSLNDAGTQGDFFMPIAAICHSDFVTSLQAPFLSAILESHVTAQTRLVNISGDSRRLEYKITGTGTLGECFVLYPEWLKVSTYKKPVTLRK